MYNGTSPFVCVFFFRSKKLDPKAQASPEGDLKLQEILNHNVGKLTAWLGRRQKIAHQIFGGRGGFRVGFKNVFQMSPQVWCLDCLFLGSKHLFTSCLED